MIFSDYNKFNILAILLPITDFPEPIIPQKVMFNLLKLLNIILNYVSYLIVDKILLEKETILKMH